MIYSVSHQNVWLRLLSSSSGSARAEKKPKNHHHKFYQHNLIIVARFVFPLRLSLFISASRSTNASIAVRRVGEAPRRAEEREDGFRIRLFVTLFEFYCVRALSKQRKCSAFVRRVNFDDVLAASWGNCLRKQIVKRRKGK